MPETRIFTSRDFDRFARKARLEDAALTLAVDALEHGAQDAKLGGNLFRQRIARRGQGKSGGYRTVVVFRKRDRAVFVEGFAKNVKKVHPPEELRALREAADQLLRCADREAGRGGRTEGDRTMRKKSNTAESKSSGVFMVDIPGRDGSAKGDSANSSTGDTLTTVHRLISGFYEAGVIDKATMRRFDEMCLTPVSPMDSKAIRELREEAGVSQAVLAKVLNVTTNAVGQWERGEKKPTGSALKLLALLREKGLSAVL